MKLFNTNCKDTVQCACNACKKTTKLPTSGIALVSMLWGYSRQFSMTGFLSNRWASCRHFDETERFVYCRKLGQTSRAAKCRLFEMFRDTATSLGRSELLENCTSYRAAKDAAEPFKTAKQLLYRKFRAGGYGRWVTKPPEEEMFTLPAAAPPASRKSLSLIPPGSACVSGRSMWPKSADRADDTLEDFT